jgi:hypothetical protein
VPRNPIPDHITFTHELTEAEASAGLLSIDDDLALLALAVDGELKLADGSELKAETILDLPPCLGNDLPAGQGMIGQVLTGPDGWLADHRPGDMLVVRLADRILDIGKSPEPDTGNADRLRTACADAAADALDRYGRGTADHPLAPLPDVILGLLRADADFFTSPLPPIGQVVRASGLETFGGSVAVRGAPWNLRRIRNLGRADVVAGTKALGLLLDDATERAAEALGYLTPSEAVTGYLADEVERRTAEGTDFAEPLAALAAAAATSREQAAVMLLTARAAEGRGDSATAEKFIHDAITTGPDLAAAPLDAGEYAACRGDVRAADGYLRRVDHVVARNLRTALARLLVPPKAERGRNQPCPCGSGRKYKMCCLGNAVHPIAERAELLYALLASYAERAAGSETLSRLVHRADGNQHAALLCVDLMLTNCGFTDRFLRARGGWLREDERKLIESWRNVPIGVFEIRQIQRGTGVTVRTLPDGEPTFLKDRLFSTGVNRLDMFCGRLFTDGARPRLLALPARVQREERGELLELLDSRPSAEEIAEFFGPRPDPYMTNADGHDYYDTEVVWDIPDEPRAWTMLFDHLTPMGADAMEWLDKHDGKTISRGRVTRDGRRWTLWANSRERLAAFEEHVRDSAPGASEISRNAQRRGGPPHHRARHIMVESFLLDPGATMADAARMHAGSWVGQEVDIFGMTPRAAAASGDLVLRRKLEMELDDMEWRNDREADHGRPPLTDVAWIRRELSIPA